MRKGSQSDITNWLIAIVLAIVVASGFWLAVKLSVGHKEAQKKDGSVEESIDPVPQTEEPSSPLDATHIRRIQKMHENSESTVNNATSSSQQLGSRFVYWSYTGEAGPQQWGWLDPAFYLCREGKEQSPIDLNSKSPKRRDQIPLELNYKSLSARLINDGRQLRAELPGGAEARILGHSYEVYKVVFHTPAEHQIDSIRYDLEIQLWHRLKKDPKQIAIIAILGEESRKDHFAFDEVLAKAPRKNDVPGHLDNFNPLKFFPPRKGYYHYRGSLTEPPCSENIEWFVLQQPIKISVKQIDRLLRKVSFNARPLQTLNNRLVVRSWYDK